MRFKYSPGAFGHSHVLAPAHFGDCAGALLAYYSPRAIMLLVSPPSRPIPHFPASLPPPRPAEAERMDYTGEAGEGQKCEEIQCCQEGCGQGMKQRARMRSREVRN